VNCSQTLSQLSDRLRNRIDSPLLLAVILFLSLSCRSFAQPRATIPSEAQQKTAAKFLESTHGISRLEGVAKKQAVMKELMELARGENLSSDERYVVLTTVISLATETGDAANWREAVNALVDGFDVDSQAERARLLKDFLLSVKGAQLRPAVEEAIAQAQVMAKDYRFSEAFALLELADDSLRKALGTDSLKRTVATARETITTRQTNWIAFQEANAKLAANANDPVANLKVGQWHAFEIADWTTALPYLAKASDLKWKTAATLELAAPTDAIKQVAIANAWYDVAEDASPATKAMLLLHSRHWYEEAQPKVTSALAKQLVAKRLEEIAKAIPSPKLVPSANTAETSTPSTPAPLPNAGEWIDLLEFAEGIDWKPRGIDWNDNVEGAPGKNGITLKARWCNRFPLPAIIDGSYELEFEFTRLDGNDGVGVFFPVQNHNMHLQFGMNIGRLDALRFIEGNRSEQSPLERQPSSLTANNQRHAVHVKVEIDGNEARLNVDVDNKERYLTWSGPLSRLHNIEQGDWRPSTIRHVWITAMNSRTVFHKARMRMFAGTIQRDVITESDREQDQKNGYVRLVGETPGPHLVGWGYFAVNQLPLFYPGDEIERRWPLISRDFNLCQDFYGAHGPSELKCPVPTGAKSFSVIGYNDSSRTAKYLVFVDGKEVYDSGVTDIAIIKVDIPNKASLLQLVVDSAGDNIRDKTYWCYPRFHSVSAEKIAEKMLDGRTGTNKFMITSSTVGWGSLTHNQAINTPKSVPIHFRDVKPCHEFIFAHAPSSVTYVVPPGMTRFSAIGYNVLSDEAKFEIWADGKRHYQSDQGGIVTMDVKLPPGTKTIDLKVNDLGNNSYDASIWCYPRLHRK
jgi:hypothetical protein